MSCEGEHREDEERVSEGFEGAGVDVVVVGAHVILIGVRMSPRGWLRGRLLPCRVLP